MDKTIYIMLVILIAALAFAVFQRGNPTEAPKGECFEDTDCVPATCCHPTEAVNKEFRPNCSNVFCTEECQPNTLDCGQGKIKCIKNKCEVLI